MIPHGHIVFLFRLVTGCDDDLLKNGHWGKNGGSNRDPAEAGKQGPIIVWVRARRAWDR